MKGRAMKDSLKKGLIIGAAGSAIWPPRGKEKPLNI